MDLMPLLQECFPGQPAFREHPWWNEEPRFRVVQSQWGEPLAHVGGITRTVIVGEERIEVLGVCDVAVTAGARGRGLMKSSLQALHLLGSQHDYAVLLTDNPRLYHSSGYIEIDGLQWGMVRGLQQPTSTWPAGSVLLNGDPW